jgi:RNA polymerase sigma-70 factor, ECF subfamily
MSSDATFLPIGFSPNQGAGEAANGERLAEARPSVGSKIDSGREEATIQSSRAQLARNSLQESAECTDELLLAQTANGSREALGLLFRRYRRPVLSVARRILRDDTEAEDVCQDVFIYMFRSAKLFDANKGTASSWIIQIAYHRSINRRQYLARRQHYCPQELKEERLGTCTQALFVDQIAAQKLLSRMREELSEEQMETLELHFFEGYSLREIAEKTNRKLGNVRSHYYRILERLRLILFPEKNSD